MWGYCRADPAACASSPRLWSCGTWPTEIATGRDRWLSNPARRERRPVRHQSDLRREAIWRRRSNTARSRRRCASRALRWHRPTWIAPPYRESPNDTTCSASNPDTLRCPAGSRGKSTARRTSPDIGPNKRTSGDDNHRRRGSHIFGTPCEGDGRSTLRTRTDQYASSIVSWGADSLAAPTFGHFGFKIVPAEKGRHPKLQKGLVGIRKVLYRTLMKAPYLRVSSILTEDLLSSHICRSISDVLSLLTIPVIL